MSTSDIAARIAILDYPGVQAVAVAGLGDVFLVANRQCARHDSNRLAVRAVAARDLPGAAHAPFQIVIVPPNLSGARGQDATRVHGWLRDQHAAGTVIASACAWAFWLGHSGLLEGRAATTHWALEDEFRAAFPQTILHPEHLLVDENDIVTAGGLMAWVDWGSMW